MEELLDRGTKLVTPEPIVNDAWRAMLIGTYMMAVNDRLNYSAGNAYAKLYEGECGDTLRSIMLFGHLDDAPAMLKPLLEFDRKATRFHVAGHKLQLLAYFYWLTRDAETVRAYEPLWRPSVELILTSREPKTGLLPKDNYAGDIAEQVYSLNSNANCWRGLRDVAAMLDDMGSKDEAAKTSTGGGRVSPGDSGRRRPQRTARCEAAVHSGRAAGRTSRPTIRSPPRAPAATTISFARTSSARRFSAKARSARIGCSVICSSTAASRWA